MATAASRAPIVVTLDWVRESTALHSELVPQSKVLSLWGFFKIITFRECSRVSQSPGKKCVFSVDVVVGHH
jgi:hypothetical protein